MQNMFAPYRISLFLTVFFITLMSGAAFASQTYDIPCAVGVVPSVVGCKCSGTINEDGLCAASKTRASATAASECGVGMVKNDKGKCAKLEDDAEYRARGTCSFIAPVTDIRGRITALESGDGNCKPRNPPCTKNTISRDGLNCIPCPTGMEANSEHTSCLCPGGQYWENNKCTSCPAPYTSVTKKGEEGESVACAPPPGAAEKPKVFDMRAAPKIETPKQAAPVKGVRPKDRP